MQTALILLMLLAIAAVPGSLYPQRSVNPALTQQFLDENGRWGEILDKLGFFGVFSSPWFSAIYLLLFISLIGCIIPRVGVHLRQLRAKPPRTPSRLTRFTGYTRIELPGAEADAVLETAHRSLRRSRYRTVVREEQRSRSVSAERGLLRESGNLVFHIALVGVLICVAGGQLTSYRGQITVVEGQGFSNSLTQYDSFDSGAWFDPTSLPPFRFTLDDFRAEYVLEGADESRVGQPLSFEADVDVTTPGEKNEKRTLQVNKPLHVDGTSMYLLGNGYAPEVTVTDPEGHRRGRGPRGHRAVRGHRIHLAAGDQGAGRPPRAGHRRGRVLPAHRRDRRAGPALDLPRPGRPAARDVRLPRRSGPGLGHPAERLRGRRQLAGPVTNPMASRC